MSFKAIIVDDERLARKELAALLSEHSEIDVIDEADGVKNAVEKIAAKNPDLLFLDIQMGNESGFDLLENINFKGKIIFVTAFDEYAVRAFEVNALDYLLKPVSPKRLGQAIARLKKGKAQSNEIARKLEYEDRLFLEENERSIFLKVSSIICIRASGDYTEIFTNDGKKLLISKPLREWGERLPEKNFLRIHRSNIINLEYIEKIEGWFNRSYRVILKGISEPLTISRRYTSELRSRFS